MKKMRWKMSLKPTRDIEVGFLRSNKQTNAEERHLGWKQKTLTVSKPFPKQDSLNEPGREPTGDEEAGILEPAEPNGHRQAGMENMQPAGKVEVSRPEWEWLNADGSEPVTLAGWPRPPFHLTLKCIYL